MVNGQILICKRHTLFGSFMVLKLRATIFATDTCLFIAHWHLQHFLLVHTTDIKVFMITLMCCCCLVFHVTVRSYFYMYEIHSQTMTDWSVSRLRLQVLEMHVKIALNSKTTCFIDTTSHMANPAGHREGKCAIYYIKLYNEIFQGTAISS